MVEEKKSISERTYFGKIIWREVATDATLRMPKNWIRIGIAILIAMFIVGIGLVSWGAMQQVEMMQLREQVKLQREQLKLLNEKANTLDGQLKNLEILDKELRQMISGSEKGQVPQGGGTNADLIKNKEVANEKDSSTNLISKFGKLQNRAQKELGSLTMLKIVLMSGAASDIQTLYQSLNYTGGENPIPSIWPVTGVITSTFGVRTDPVNGGGSIHEGIDISNEYGTPIVATATGIVDMAEYSDAYGLLVEIDHGHGLKTRYAHNSTILVTPGMKVRQGDTIALMGSTGKSTGVHSHYEVRIFGEAVNPIMFLPAN